MVSFVAGGSSEYDDNVIAEVVRLLAYAFICLNSLLCMTKKFTPYTHTLQSHEETDDGNGGDFEESHDGEDGNDEEDVISHLLETSNISKHTNIGVVGSSQKGGGGKSTKDCGSSGKDSSLIDCGRYRSLTSKLLQERENTHPNRLTLGLNKSASVGFSRTNVAAP